MKEVARARLKVHYIMWKCLENEIMEIEDIYYDIMIYKSSLANI